MGGRELRDILAMIRGVPHAAEKGVLATLVSVRGSTYRRPGARMLVIDARRICGTISGGCLEAEVCRQARDPGAAPRVIEFNTIDDDDALIGYSMGCKGVIRILIQPVGQAQTPWNEIESCLDAGQACCLATFYSGSRIGQQILLSRGRFIGLHDDSAALSNEMRRALQDGRSRNRTFDLADGPAEVFIEPILPPVSLIIFGGGPDAAPVAQIAQALGWQVTIVDPRSREVMQERFPHARSIIESTPVAAVTQLRFTARTAAVVMTHNYAHDVDLLAALPPDAAYVGLLGPRHRTAQLADDLKKRGVELARRLTNLYSPVGLDIGTNNPEEIALAIVAEIQAALSGRGGGHLRDRAGDIHDPPGAAAERSSP